MNEEKRVEQVAAAIRAYLDSHPQAADTAEGVHRWWIDWGDAEESPDVTRRALALLAERGVMDSVETARRRVWHARRPE